MSRRFTPLRFVAALSLLMVPAIPATAQQRLFARVGSTLAEVDTSSAKLGAVLHTWSLPAGTSGSPIPVAGGRYLAWAFTQGEGEFVLVALDTVSGSVSSIPLGEPVMSGGIFGTDAEGEELVLFAVGPDAVMRIIVLNVHTRQSRTIPLAGPLCSADYALAGDAKLLMLLRHPDCGFVPVGPRLLDIVDLQTGSIREHVFDVPFGSGQRIATNAAGTRLWVGTAQPGFNASPGIRLYDVATGALLALNTALHPAYVQTGIFPLMVDDESQRILMVTEDGLAALDGETLRLLGTADVPVYRPAPPLPNSEQFWGGDVAFHPNAEAMYVHEYSGQLRYYSGLCHHSALIAIDPATGRRLATRPAVAASGGLLCGVELVMTVAPARPPNFRADVSGRRVTLSWDRPAQTTHYELEAGSAPGLRDLLRVTSTSLPFVVENVPPGTYYVRVRALNYAGKGAYTEDLTVVVP